MRAVASSGTAVRNLRDTAMIVHHEPHRVGVSLTVVEAAWLLLDLQVRGMSRFSTLFPQLTLSATLGVAVVL